MSRCVRMHEINPKGVDVASNRQFIRDMLINYYILYLYNIFQLKLPRLRGFNYNILYIKHSISFLSYIPANLVKTLN